MPSLYQLFFFRVGRMTIKQLSDRASIDYQYYADKGWLESDYYYPIQMNPLMKATGSLMDSLVNTFRSVIS